MSSGGTSSAVGLAALSDGSGLFGSVLVLDELDGAGELAEGESTGSGATPQPAKRPRASVNDARRAPALVLHLMCEIDSIPPRPWLTRSPNLSAAPNYSDVTVQEHA